jgi:hypothetical protein
VNAPRPACALRVEEELKRQTPPRRKQLFRIACRFTYYSREPGDDAQELVAEALAAASDPERYPWDPQRHGFLTHMTWVMRRLAYEHARSAYAEREVVDSEIAHEDALTDASPLADQALHAARQRGWLRELGARLVALLEKRDPIAAQSLRHGMAGIESHAEQAALIGCSAEDIAYAYDRLKYHGRQLREDWEREEDRRMRALRERAAAARHDERPWATEEEL